MFKNKTFKNVFTIVVFVLVFVSVLVDVNFFLGKVQDKNQNKIWLAKYQQVATEVVDIEANKITSTIVNEKLIGRDEAGNKVATLYSATVTNEFGEIELIVAVNNSDTIIGIEAFIFNQTLNQDKSLNFINNYKGVKLSSLRNTADTSGATVSKNSIVLLMEEIATLHLSEVK